jgi:hypothetical protein
VNIDFLQGPPGGVKGEKGEPGEAGKRVSVMTINGVYKKPKYVHVRDLFLVPNGIA